MYNCRPPKDLFKFTVPLTDSAKAVPSSCRPRCESAVDKCIRPDMNLTGKSVRIYLTQVYSLYIWVYLLWEIIKIIYICALGVLHGVLCSITKDTTCGVISNNYNDEGAVCWACGAACQCDPTKFSKAVREDLTSVIYLEYFQIILYISGLVIYCL